MIITANELRQLSSAEFESLGLLGFAYIKRVELDGQPAWEIHRADGGELDTLLDRDLAFTVCRQNELEPLSVH